MIGAQNPFDLNADKTLFSESDYFKRLENSKNNNLYLFTLSTEFYLNTNLPNLENHNGLYLPKGSGGITGFLFYYGNKYLTLSAEPQIFINKKFEIDVPEKKGVFGVLNDVPLKKNSNYHYNDIRNIGIKLKYQNHIIGYGNWNSWLGPGVHNSLTLSNNSKGFYHYFLETSGDLDLIKKIKYNLKYMVSDRMFNDFDNEYYLSILHFSLKHNLLEFGLNTSILSGGQDNIKWNQSDAINAVFNKQNAKYWDSFNVYYLLADFEASKLKLFIEIGFLNTSYINFDKNIYNDHAIGTNMGIRKYGAFGNSNTFFGIEYLRLAQGIYYDILPTPNWYDNVKYSYSSYLNRRWAAHSGSDSEDLLIFIGYKNSKVGFIYGLNYERHGITYNFPPEVKFETRYSIHYSFKNINLYINYENELFEHYGFVDNNTNVWSQTYNEGSLQATKTLLFTLEHYIR